MIHFDTDYMEGAHPEILRRLTETNLEQTAGYGSDAHLANSALERLQKIASFELWGPKGETETLVRFVTSWATQESSVDALIEAL